MARRTEISLWRLLVVGWLTLCYGAGTARADIHTDLQVRYRLDEGAMSSTAPDSATNGAQWLRQHGRECAHHRQVDSRGCRLRWR
jgi:hypothetical protein